MKNVRRFGQKLAGGVRTIARKISNTAGQVAEAVSPLATMINPELGLAVEGAARSVQAGARGVERLAGKGEKGLIKGFKAVQQPVLGIREIGKIGQQIAKNPMAALKNPEQPKIMIGDVVAARMKPRKAAGIQRGDEPVNDWAPELPFAGM